MGACGRKHRIKRTCDAGASGTVCGNRSALLGDLADVIDSELTTG